jgi:hypothetical protein
MLDERCCKVGAAEDEDVATRLLFQMRDFLRYIRFDQPGIVPLGFFEGP